MAEQKKELDKRTRLLISQALNEIGSQQDQLDRFSADWRRRVQVTCDRLYSLIDDHPGRLDG